MPTTVLIHSGGLDSTVLLYFLLEQHEQVYSLGFDYGQRHKVELARGDAVCRDLRVERRVVDLTNLRGLLRGSSQTDERVDVPEGHYAEESMKATIVPNRNMIMLSIAAGWALSRGARQVAYAAHAGDHAIYPDCRPEFATALDAALQLADWRYVQIHRPFLEMTKADIVRLGVRLRVPFEDTYSCYKGHEKHCGKCGTCVERKEAFDLAGMIDPVPYDD